MTNAEAIGILAIVVETAKGRCFVTDEAISDAYGMAISALEAQESTHPEIIECKECQCFEIAKNEVNGFCTKHGICPDVYDFCSMAERRTDGDQ